MNGNRLISPYKRPSVVCGNRQDNVGMDRMLANSAL